jgi:RNA recognition motif-containing protein
MIMSLMIMNIYVGNLPKELTNEELQQLFAKHGTVESARVINDRLSGEPRGFGFVEMPDHNEAESAIQKLNGTDLKGRALVVNEARDRRPTGGGRPPFRGGDRRGGDRNGGGYRDRGDRGGYRN